MGKPMVRKAIPPFVVSLGKDVLGTERWVGPDGKPVASRGGAQEFRLYRSATLAEKARADMLAHEIAGGLDAWMDLQVAYEGVRVRLRTAVEAEVWKDGKPAVKTAADVAEQEAAFAAGWAANDSQDRSLFQSLQVMIDRIAFMARWEVTAIGGKDGMPDDWCAISSREMDGDVLDAIWSTFVDVTKDDFAGK